MDRGAWRATVHRVAKIRTRLSDKVHNKVNTMNALPSFLLKTAWNNRPMSSASSSACSPTTEFLRQSLRILHALHCSNIGFSKCHSLKDNFEIVKGRSLVL